VEDFESTLAELQSFIDGDVLTSLGDSGAPQAAQVGTISISVLGEEEGEVER
jgi:hypothetical protein